MARRSISVSHPNNNRKQPKPQLPNPAVRRIGVEAIAMLLDLRERIEQRLAQIGGRR
jgi:hypothetical protein